LDRAASPQMFIVARRHPELYDYLSTRFADDPNLTVVLDRRLTPRRRRALPAAAERRRVDRRSRPEVDEQLRATSLAVVTASSAAGASSAAAAVPVPVPANDARQWIEAMHRGVNAVRSALEAHERLQAEAQSIKQEHDRFQHEAKALEHENERLRAEIDHARTQLAGLDAGISHAIEVVTDLHSRLNKEPDRDPPR
jgi:septal ring factor EnvC (AmiA/AmiB activator)